MTSKAAVGATVSVHPHGMGITLTSLKPGQTTVVDAWLPGPFTVTVVPSSDWLAWARQQRDKLQQSTEPSAVKQQLADIEYKLSSYERGTMGAPSCSATLKAAAGLAGDEFWFMPLPIVGAGSAAITTDATNALAVTCTAVEVSTGGK